MTETLTGTARGRQLVAAALLIGGLVAGAALPKLLRSGRRAARRIGGMTYRSQPSTG